MGQARIEKDEAAGTGTTRPRGLVALSARRAGIPGGAGRAGAGKGPGGAGIAPGPMGRRLDDDEWPRRSWMVRISEPDSRR